MKRLLFLFLLILPSFCFSQAGWVVRTIGTTPLRSINFISPDSVFAYNNTGTTYYTTNQGGYWWNQTAPPNNGILVAKNYDANNVYAVGSVNPFGLVSYSSNGGYSWRRDFVSAGGYCYLECLAVINQSTAYAGGLDFNASYSGVLFKTTNYGVNWTQSFFAPATEFYDLYFKNENEGTILGFVNIYKTTNAGQTFTISGQTPFVCYSFTDPYQDTSYMCGAGGKVARTINGGINWTVYQMPHTANLNKIFKLSSKIVYAIGNNARIYKTTNAGEDWLDQSIDRDWALNDIEFINESTGFICGDSGRVIRTTTGGPVFVSNINTSVPESYSLSQNYPNPFNPTTNINYDIPTSALVSLKVFDISGKEIESLVNQNQNPGSYSVTFNASNYPSGIYFYKLESNNFSETKKMLLIK